MKIGDRVGFHWDIPDGSGVGRSLTIHGQGVIVEFPDELHAYVAADPQLEGAPHHLIYCALTWLTVVP